jgi:hypothetical protein
MSKKEGSAMRKEWSVMLGVCLASLVASGATSCASSTAPAAQPAERPPAAMAAAAPMAKTIVEIKVNADGSVDQEEVHLSVSKKQEVHWELVGSGTLQIVADEEEGAWPLHVKCDGGRCQGKLKDNPKHDRHPYHAVVNGGGGTDPVIIIDG